MEDQKQWTQLHDELRKDLQQEIHLTRELLTNLNQEELSLMRNDSGTLNSVFEQRSTLLEKLSGIRIRRQKTTEKIGQMTSSPSASEDMTTEILFLSDQLLALTEKMNRQNTRNTHLSQHPEHMPQARVETKPKRKASIATYDVKK